MKSNVIEISVQVLRETDKAVLVTPDIPEHGKWLPKSQVELHPSAVEGIVTLVLPEWLATKEGLV